MSEGVMVALIAAVPGTITAVATLLEVTHRRRDAETRRGHADYLEPPELAGSPLGRPPLAAAACDCPSLSSAAWC